MKNIFLVLLATIISISCKNQHADLPDGLYAEIETNKGTILAQLEYTKAPITVANFVTLAEGKNEFVDKKYEGKPFFDGLLFHRVVPNFVIQAGDPDGTGAGGPGYKFMDEITDLLHNKPGTLSMANAGPGTNGSQFFITHTATEHLDGRHTVFGYVIGDGMTAVNKINEGDHIKTISIIRVGEAAKRFDAVKTFLDYVAIDQENQKKREAAEAENQRLYDQKYKVVKDAKAEALAKILATSAKTPTGLQYKILKKGSGKKPEAGTTIFLHYAGYLKNGELFDSSIESVAKEFGKYDENRAMQMGYQPIPFTAGRKDGMIPGFIEGIEKLSYGDKAVIFVPAHLGYGEQGARVIPPNADLIFELELMEPSR